MSLQWTAVATFLYAEVFAVLLLCIPFISPKRWQKIFKSRLVELVVTYGNTFFVVLIIILVLLVIDAVREIRKYDDVTEKVNLQNNPGAMEHFHMKLFRAQRNLYIAGFSLLLSFLLRRLVTLISQQATLLASNEAFKKQAESASEAAKKYMEENDQLKKEAAEDGGKLDVGSTEVKLEENKSLKNDLKKLKDELANTKKKLEKAENEALAMQKQSEGLTKEYDRLLEEHAKLQEPGDEALHTYKLWPGQLRQVPHVPVHFLPNNAKPPDHQPLPHSCPRAPANLAVQTEQQQHEEEQGSPEWGHRHQCDSPWVGNEG
ncbi:B cell receptor associated protein 31 [Cricetulus griseus]